MSTQERQPTRVGMTLGSTSRNGGEFQGSKPATANRALASEIDAHPTRPAASKLATLQERLAKRLPDLEITDGIDGFIVKPRRYLDDAWAEINEVVRSLGGKWQKGLKSTDGAWRIPK